MKDSRLSFILSLLFPGLGQIYNGETEKGILFIIVECICIVMVLFLFTGFITGCAIWLWAAVDAYRYAERINKSEREDLEKRSD